MDRQLDSLSLHLKSYRHAVDWLVKEAISNPKGLYEPFQEIHLCAARLYVDYLLVMKEPWTLPKGPFSIVEPRGDRAAEASLRKWFREELGASLQWSRFDADDAFSEWTGLRSTQDYIDAFALHLPEIYEEARRMEECVTILLTHPHESVLVWVQVGMEHMGRNHIRFALAALDLAADEDRWA